MDGQLYLQSHTYSIPFLSRNILCAAQPRVHVFSCCGKTMDGDPMLQTEKLLNQILWNLKKQTACIHAILRSAIRVNLRMELSSQEKEYRVLELRLRELAEQRAISLRETDPVLLAVSPFFLRLRLLVEKSDSHAAASRIRSAAEGIIQYRQLARRYPVTDQALKQLQIELLDCQIAAIESTQGYL